MVPLAIGTQTNGSVIRPASFCGVFGFKPTHRPDPALRRAHHSPPLDHVGVFARSLEDLALLAEALVGFDAARPGHPARGAAAAAPGRGRARPVPPRLAFVRGPIWDQAEPATREAFAELADILGERIPEVELPRPSPTRSRSTARSGPSSSPSIWPIAGSAAPTA